ncbi:MAG TPA: hypothetical protein VM938_06980 [Acidimicrobiales bacterium]|nr:hypothetical protein [Acidimicrobiales bacterium]
MSDFERLGWRPDDHPRLTPDELEGELGRVVTAGRHQRARRRAAIGGALAVASILTVASVAALRSPENADLHMVDVPTATTPTTVGEPSIDTSVPPVTGVTTTTAPAVARPPFVVVVRPSGTAEAPEEDIVVLDSQSGKDIGTIYRTQDHGDIHAVTLSPDRKHVYFIEENCGNGPVLRIPVDGSVGQKGEPVTSLPSADPAISSDGRFLAYLTLQGCDPPEVAAIEWQVRVRDLTTGADRVVAGDAKGYRMLEPAWSPDGKTLALAVERWEGDKPVEAFLALLDPSKSQDTLRAPRLSSKREGFGFRSPTYLPDGNLFLIETPVGSKVGAASAQMLVVGGRSGAPIRQVATGDPNKTYHRTDADPTGAHLLYMSATDHNDPGELRVSSNGARTTVLAGGVTEGTW